jgi:hypothetical protein
MIYEWFMVYRRGQVVQPPQMAESKRWKRMRQNEKKMFFCSQQFEVIKPNKVNSINNRDILEFIISVRGCHFDYLHWSSKDLGTPLSRADRYQRVR